MVVSGVAPAMAGGLSGAGSPGQPPKRLPNQRAGVPGGATPRRYWPLRSPGDRWCRWAPMPRGQARWDGRVRRL